MREKLATARDDLMFSQCILLVTRNLPPLVGGMERLNWHMAEELSRHAEVRVIGPQGAAAQAPPGIIIREVPLTPLWRFLFHARRLARYEARQWHPDVVFAGSGLTAPIARSAARLCQAKTVVYAHGLDVAVKHPLYRAIWHPTLRHAERIIANSQSTAALCRNIGIDDKRIGIVHPGVTLPEVSPDTAAITRFRTEHNLNDRPLLLSVGRLSTRKGLREFVTHSLLRITASHPDAILLIVGDAPKDALHAKAQTPESIRAAAEQAGVVGNLRFLGKISDTDLGVIYRAADVHIFPVRDIPSDPEGFGMVAIEAAAHGLPTVAFATGGVVDAVAQDRSGDLVAPGDYTAFADAVLHVLVNRNLLRASCTEFAQQFAWTAFGTQIAAQLTHVAPK